ncbi:MAG: hypothetical protein IKK77_06390 [Clostridia bacterium]|nr:hypothetical protein [Clostridia bacterium]
MSKLYAINIYDTTTEKEKVIYVSKEVYDEFRRGEWRIEKNDSKHRANETQFSALLGGDDGAYENFHEFVDNDSNPEELIFRAMMVEKLYRALAHLEEADRELIEAIFFQEMTERAYAEKKGVYRNAIHKRKQKILQELKKFLI